MRTLLLFAVLSASPMCTPHDTGTPQDKTPGAVPRPRTLAEAERDYVAAADLVFVGVVKHVGKPPEVGTTHFSIAYQEVEYEVVEVLAGRFGPERVIVAHILAGGRTTVLDRGPEHLDPELFELGGKRIVAAKFFPHDQHDGCYVVRDEHHDFSPYVHSAERMTQIRAMLASR